MDDHPMTGEYEAPETRDYGDLLELTGHKGMSGAEDGCSKTNDGGVCSTP